MEFHHITIAADGRLPLFKDEAARRLAIHSVARIAANDLVLFNLVDEHSHVVTAGSRDRAATVAQSLSLSFAHQRGQGLEPARIRPVENRRHLESLIPYVLQQGPHHQLDHDPALWTGSCFLDIVGARYLPNLQLCTKAAFPRLRMRDIFIAVGLPEAPIHPANPEDIFGAGLMRLLDAASAAFAASSPPLGRHSRDVLARRAAVQLALQAGFTTRQIARVLDSTQRAVQRLAHRDLPAKALDAVRIRLALEDRVGLARRKTAA